VKAFVEAMECLNPEASVDDCNMSEMIGYLGAILAGVFVCSCALSGCCFYCRWKMKKPDVGAITLKSSKTGVKEEVRFHVFERKGTEESQAQVGPAKSTKSAASSASRKSGKDKKTVVSWQLDTQSPSTRSLVSTGKVLLTTVGEGKAPRDLRGQAASNAPSNATSPNRRSKPKKEKDKKVQESRWRAGIAGLTKILNSGCGFRKDAYSVNENVEYFSASNGIWTHAVIVSSGAFGDDGLPSYTVRVGRQRRHNVPIKFIRPTLAEGEHVGFFSGLETSWTNAKIVSPPRALMLGYELDVLDEKSVPAVAVAGRLRRRFVASQAAQIYQGAFLGWVDAVILEDAEEIADAIPGQRLQENGETADVSEALCPEVLVKCHLRYDDAEEMEILEVPSGCVRYISGFN